MVDIVRLEGKGYYDLQLPHQHPLFLLEPSCPVPQRVGIPLIIHRLRTRRENEAHPNRHHCQPATYLKVDPDTQGFAPEEWQSSVGPCYVARPQTVPAATSRNHFNTSDMTLIFAFIDHLLEQYGDDMELQPERDLSSTSFSRFVLLRGPTVLAARHFPTPDSHLLARLWPPSVPEDQVLPSGERIPQPVLDPLSEDEVTRAQSRGIGCVLESRTKAMLDASLPLSEDQRSQDVL